MALFQCPPAGDDLFKGMASCVFIAEHGQEQRQQITDSKYRVVCWGVGWWLIQYTAVLILYAMAD